MDTGAYNLQCSFLFVMDAFKELAGLLCHLLTELSSLLHARF